MRAFGVVVDAPVVNDKSGLAETVENFAIRAFVSELAGEGLTVAIFPKVNQVHCKGF